LKSDNLTKDLFTNEEGSSEDNLDAILDKISNKGIDSLTIVEKELLKTSQNKTKMKGQKNSFMINE
jgi:hypothetical protein